MPTTRPRREDRWIDLLLSLYDSGLWSGDRSESVYPDRLVDGGVDRIATRKSDGLRLAIEHTAIELFVGEKTDFHSHFSKLQQMLKSDRTLLVRGSAVYVNAPVNVLPRGCDWEAIIQDVARWIRANASLWSGERSLKDCPTTHHPLGHVMFEVHRDEIKEDSEGFLIIQRYGPTDVAASVDKALETKLPKLAAAAVDRRMLLLERDQTWLDIDRVYGEIERLRPKYPQLASVDEIWIADTATFEANEKWVEFSNGLQGELAESFAFYDSELHSQSKGGWPIPLVPRPK